MSLEHNLAGIGHLLKGQVEPRFDVLAQADAVILGITGHSDDRQWLIEPIRVVDRELATDRNLTMKEVLDHGFIDDGDAL